VFQHISLTTILTNSPQQHAGYHLVRIIRQPTRLDQNYGKLVGQPLKDFVKLSVDASIDADDLRDATGAIICDCNRLFIAASTSKLKSVHDVLSAEMHALISKG
jgi:hypothetical protein